MRRYQIATNVNSTGLVGSIQVIENGRIKSVRWDSGQLAEVDANTTFYLIRGTSSTSDALTSKVDPSILSTFSNGVAITTSGVGQTGAQHQELMDIFIGNGESLYVVAANGTATPNCNLTCTIDVIKVGK